MSACPSLASTQDHSFTIIPIFLRLDAPASVQFTMVGDKAINYVADFCHYKRFFGHVFRKKTIRPLVGKWSRGQG